MSWYTTSKTKKPKKIKKFENPHHLLKWMKKIDYGWMDSDYNEYTSTGGRFWEKYSMLLPHEVYTHRLGTCWDQTVFAKHVFDQMEIPSRMIFVQQYGIGTHTFLIFKESGKWYHFENAFNDHRGIHGPYRTIKEIAKKVSEWVGGESGGSWKIMNPKYFQKKLTCKEFMDACDYNYKEMEEEER